MVVYPMETVSSMGSGSLGRSLDLGQILEALQEELSDELELSHQDSSMATVRSEGGKGPAYTLYRTGTFQIRSSKGPDQLFRAKDWLIDVLERVGIEPEDVRFDHKTSVFLEELDSSVNLNALAISLGLEQTEYEPEQFPGLVFRPEDQSATLIVFASGKVIIGGVTREKDAEPALAEVRSRLEKKR